MRFLSQHLGFLHKVVEEFNFVRRARQRITLAVLFFTISYSIVGWRLLDVMLVQSWKRAPVIARVTPSVVSRSDIIDRNGQVLATHLITGSLYANPQMVIHAEDAAKKLSHLFPDIPLATLRTRLESDKSFTWIARHISPKQQQAVYALGIPGIYIQRDEKRIYPFGRLAAHVLGYCGLDGDGLAGLEQRFNDQLIHITGKEARPPLCTSLDIRVQHVVYQELLSALNTYQATAGNAIVMKVKTGEILGMVSLPDFDPNSPGDTPSESLFNRNTLGTYEPGSTFKILNVAIALETGSATLNSRYDARFPIHIGRFKVDDFKGKYRELNLEEAFVYSSNIAAIKIAQQFGSVHQKYYFKKFGVFEPTTLEIPEMGRPLIPKNWSAVTTMTASYGYGISVTPIQLVSIVNTLIHDGSRVQPTLRISSENTSPSLTPVISKETSAQVRRLMRLVVAGKKADITGYRVFGKTGTAYQAQGKSYQGGKQKMTTFVGAFPLEDPEYIVLVMLENPKATPTSHGYSAAGWNAAPVAGTIISRIAPILGVVPVETDPDDDCIDIEDSSRNRLCNFNTNTYNQ